MLVQEQTNSLLLFQALNKYEYITEDQSCLDLDNIPIIYKNNIPTVDYIYINHLSEIYNLDHESCLNLLKEHYELSNIYIQIPDYVLFENPEYRDNDLLIESININDPIYQYCDYLTDLFLETNNTAYLQSLIEDEEPGKSDVQRTIDAIQAGAKGAVAATQTAASAAKSSAKVGFKALKFAGKQFIQHEKDLWKTSSTPFVAASKRYDDRKKNINDIPLVGKGINNLGADNVNQALAVKDFALHPTTLAVGAGGYALYKGIKKWRNKKKSNTINNEKEKSIIDKAGDVTGKLMDQGKKEDVADMLNKAFKIGKDENGKLLIKTAEHMPNTWIAKKISALRAKYYRWMLVYKHNPDPGIKNKLKKACAMILQVIDKLLALLQRATDSSTPKEKK